MKRFALLLSFLILPLVLWSCSADDTGLGENQAAVAQSQSGQSSSGTAVAQEPAGQAAMRLSVPDPDGVPHQLSKWIGQQPVVINFWGTWCPPCRREIPDLVRLYDEYRDRDVEIISIALEKTPNPGPQVRAFVRQAGMEWVQLMANEQVVRVFEYRGSVPTTIFLDREGREVNRHVGARTYDMFKQDFEAIAGS
jgi:thiol-disulfide isomerase/thioredoxin